MTDDPGPYVEMDGPSIWVPRTVAYRSARSVAREAIQEYDHRLSYVGKTEQRLLGFTRDCLCEEMCEAKPLCPKVPVWHFREVEP